MKRDFTYIDDIVSGVLSSLVYSADFEIFNLGRGNVRNLQVLVKALESHFGKANVVPVKTPGGEVLMTYADTTKAERLLGYKPKVEVEEGVRRWAEWYKNYKKVKLS